MRLWFMEELRVYLLFEEFFWKTKLAIFYVFHEEFHQTYNSQRLPVQWIKL